MSLDKDINQRKWRNEYQKVMVNLIYSHNWVQEHAKRFFESADITAQQFNILRILRGAGAPLSTLQIRQRMLDKMSDTSRIVDRLVAKELAAKKVCATDRRLVDVAITEKGHQLLASFDLRLDEMEKIVGRLTQEEAALLNTLLDKMRGSKP